MALKRYIYNLAHGINRYANNLLTYTTHKIVLRRDIELRNINKIIKKAKDNKHILNKNDDIFITRLKTNAEALKMNFWERHFESMWLSDYPEISGRILDFGCGSGHLDVLLARKGQTIHGIDMSSIAISIANHIRMKEIDSVQKRLSFAVADVTRDLPIGDKFDSAWSAHVFEHIVDPTAIFLGLRNWLKDGAYMMISVPLGTAYDDPDHVNHFFNSEELRSFLSSHITVIKVNIFSEYQVIRALCRLS